MSNWRVGANCGLHAQLWCGPDDGNDLHIEILLALRQMDVEVRGQGNGGRPVNDEDVELPRVVGEQVPVPTPVEKLLLGIQGLLLRCIAV